MELLLPLLFLLPLIWLFSRQRKQQQAQAQLRNQLQPGQEVMTTAGLFGTVVKVEGEVMHLQVSPGVVLRFMTGALAKVVPTDIAAEPDPGTPQTPDAPQEQQSQAIIDLDKHENRREA